MSVTKYQSQVRQDYDIYKIRTQKELRVKDAELTRLKHKLAFYTFEFHIRRGTLPQNIKDVYDLNNSDSRRLEKVMSDIDLNKAFEVLPAEIKMVIEEMIL